ncbi:MAG: hypothetical protein AB3N23_10145 [Paracoccaceae bacterium]
MDLISIDLDPVTQQALHHVAKAEGCSVSDIVRQAINRDLYRRGRAKKADRPDERLVAPLRALLADDLAFSNGWQDLQTRLAKKGYGLRESGGGLILVELPSCARVAKASDLGYSYARLMRRFGVPFPGHKHRVVPV